MRSSFILLIGISLAILSAVFSTPFIPDRFRNGRFYKELLAKDNHVSSSVEYSWQAPIDHFDKHSNATFTQRYFVDNQYYKEGSPVFFQIGGEGTLTKAPSGYIAEIGQKYNALLVSLEHRYYGESLPFPKPNTKEYRFLTVDQALADLASFTDYFKTKIDPSTKNAPWFVFGGSYPGALASWYRTSYPNHSVGSLSSSGVVNSIIDYYQFDVSVRAAAGNDCGDNIRRIQNAFEKKINKEGEKGLQESLALFNCEKDMSKKDFYYMIADSWSMVIQYSNKSSLCNAISLPASATDDEIMKNFATFSNEYWGEDFCNGGFYNTRQLAEEPRWEVNSRSWRYQTCDEVSYFNTAPARGSLRSTEVNLDYHLKQCEEAFGKKMFPSSDKINKKFGADFPKADKVFYSNFYDDPWQRASVTAPVSENQPYYLALCNDCGHCMDFHSSSDSDPQELKNTRTEFEKYLKLWISEYEA